MMRAWRTWRLPGRWPDVGRRSTVARWTRRRAAPAYARIPDLTYRLLSGKPTAPEGPLEVSDVWKDHCRLSWKAPKDDGGEPLKHYKVQKMDTTTGKWTDVADVTEPEALVKGLIPGNQFKFRVMGVNKIGQSVPLTTEGTTLAKDPYGTFYKILAVNSIQQK